MFEFVAIGPNPDERWRRRLSAGQRVRLGRAPRKGWSVPWDLRISREHVDLTLVGDRLEVRCLPTARNPIYRQGEPRCEFSISAGEDFRIGGTLFRLDEATPEQEAAERRDAPPVSSTSADVAALKAQVAELRELVAAQSQSRGREQPRESLDLEMHRLRSEVEALQTQLAAQRSVREEKDREIRELRARLAALESRSDDDIHTKRTLGDLPADAVPPRGEPAAGQSERKSSLFVLKAQIEAQAAKLRAERGHASRGGGATSKDSDIEALKQLLEDRAAQKAGASVERRAKTDSSQRRSHIAALLALHEARRAEKAAARPPNESAADAESPAHAASAEPAGQPPSIERRIWRSLDANVQQLVREIAAGRALDDSDKLQLMQALNALIVDRRFLLDSELQHALHAAADNDPRSKSRRRWSETEVRRAARLALQAALSALPRSSAATSSLSVESLHRGQGFGLEETLLGRPYGASYVALPTAPPGRATGEEDAPVELVRLDGILLWRLYEASPRFRDAVDELRRKVGDDAKR